MRRTGKPTKAGDGLMRVTISIPIYLDKLVRSHQIKLMEKTNKNISYSKTVSDILEAKLK